jgi:hypothetical protein
MNASVIPSQELPPPVAMLQMIQGFWVSRAIYVAAELRIADVLEEGPQSAAQLAEATGTHAPSLYRVLRALASVGVFREDPEGRFSLTPVAGTLQSNKPGSLRELAIVELAADHYPAWEAVLHSVKTGEVAFHKVFGMDAWEHRARNREHGALFDDAMANFCSVVNQSVIESYDFSQFSTVVDVGGGDGSLLVDLLRAHPTMNGIVFDLPQVTRGTQKNILENDLADRCEVVSGDFLDSVPRGADAYVLKWIIHDWDDANSITIFKNCRRAMSKDSKLLIVEAVLPPGNEPSFSKFMDLNMMVMLGGRERTEKEYRSLLGTAGFRVTGFTPTHTEMTVIEAVPA